ncbi:MAG: DUF455 family protein [Thermoleophilaceae bacterium]|nr:DUF455 family protein [Thermoleophilaceae bacterium]
MRPPEPAPLRPGYDVDENAARFSNYLHVLRELVHRSCGWLPLEPSFERKYALGDHLHDDARSVSKVRRRLYELRHPSDYPGAPGAELMPLLQRMEAAGSPDEYVRVAYGEAKPALLRAIRIHLDALDPVTDEPSLRLLRQLFERQLRHARALAVPNAEPGEEIPIDVGAVPVRLRERRELTVMAPLAQPVRDAFVSVTEDGDPYLVDELYVNGDENHVPTDPEEQRHFFHGLMDAELCAAELMARNSHEHPEMPWDFHVDMARQTWDELRHARVHDVLMATELGCRWGDYPVGFSYFRSIYALDLLGRLALFNGTSEQRAMWRHSHRRKKLVELGQASIAKVFDYLLADEVPHVHNGARWGSYLLDGDERAYRERVRELRAGLDATGAPQAAAR